MENTINMDDLGVPLFSETPIAGQITTVPKPEWIDGGDSLTFCHHLGDFGGLVAIICPNMQGNH